MKNVGNITHQLQKSAKNVVSNYKKMIAIYIGIIWIFSLLLEIYFLFKANPEHLKEEIGSKDQDERIRKMGKWYINSNV